MTEGEPDRVREAFVALLAEHVEPNVTIRGEDSITGDLGLDSLAIMEIMADVEDRFGITIPDDVLPELQTVDDVVRALEARQLAPRSRGPASQPSSPKKGPTS